MTAKMQATGRPTAYIQHMMWLDEEARPGRGLAATMASYLDKVFGVSEQFLKLCLNSSICCSDTVSKTVVRHPKPYRQPAMAATARRPRPTARCAWRARVALHQA